MKVTTTTSPVLTHLPTSVKQFTIKASAKAFQILMAQIYSDKVTAVIREICSNAYDAHAAAGNPEVPFKVDLPSMLNPMFSVRDYGIGMDEDTVFGLYSTFFASDKEFTNDAVGCLGLGSKSPFAVSDSFFVTTYSGEVRRSYMVFLDQDIPSISKVDDSPCDEPRGVEIKFSVPANQHYEYGRKAAAVFESFSVMPILNGAVSTKPAPKLTGKDWELHIGGGASRVVVRQGCVEYPLNVSSTRFHFPSLPYAAKMVLIAPIGSVAITPSRESLSYDSMTIVSVQEMLNIASEELRSTIDAMLDDAEVLPELDRMKRASEFAWLEGHDKVARVRNWSTINLLPKPKRGTRVSNSEAIAAHAIRRTTLLGDVRAGRYQYQYMFNAREINLLKLFFIPDISARGLKGRIEQEVRTYGHFSYVSDLASFKRIVRVLGLRRDQVKGVQDLPVLPKKERVKNTAPKLSKFYTLMGLRLQELAVPKDFLWVTKAGREKFIDANGLEMTLTVVSNVASATKKTILCVNQTNVDKVDQTNRLSLRNFLKSDPTTMVQLEKLAMSKAINSANFSNDAKNVLRESLKVITYPDYPLASLYTRYVNDLVDLKTSSALKHLYATYPDLLPLKPPTPAAIKLYVINPAVPLQR